MAGFPQDVTNKNLSIIKSGSDDSFVVEMEGAKSAKDVKVQISEIVKDTPANKAGLEVGDTIVKAGEKEIKSIEDLQNYTEENLGKPIILSIARGKENITKEVIPRVEYPDGEGAMGVSLVRTAIVSYSPLEAIRKGYEDTVHLTIFIIMSFAGIVWGLITTGKTAAEVSGPVGIAIMTQQAAAMGFMTILHFTALISINLAIINALPFPALDGGRLLFLIVEKIKGSPINQKWEAKANNVGFALLMVLMVLITFKDVAKFDLWGKVMGMLG